MFHIKTEDLHFTLCTAFLYNDKVWSEVTGSTEQSHWGGKKYSVKKFPAVMEPKGSSPCSQDPTTGLYLSQMNPVHILSIIPVRPILILSPHLCLCVPNDLSPLAFATKMLYPCPPDAFYIPPTSSVLGPSSFFCPNILLSTPFSNTLSLYVLQLNVRDQVSHPYKTRGKSYSFIYFGLYISR
jgi:hypothetical protein